MDQTELVCWMVEKLNAMLETDAESVLALFNKRVYCEHALAEKMADLCWLDGKGNYRLGVLGLLNYLLGPDENGCGLILMNCVVDEPYSCDPDQVLRRIEGFQVSPRMAGHRIEGRNDAGNPE